MENMGDARRAAMAIDALRRGWAITVTNGDLAMILSPVETAQDVTSDN